jgi:FkbM family methyltransferase
MSLFSRLDIPRTYHEWQYRRLAESAVNQVIDGASLAAQGYSSQCGQDKWLVETMFPGLRNGIFIDIGAHDGVSFSNTVFLEKQLGWTGLAVEPMPDVFERLSRNRSCIKVNGCISADSRKASFLKISGYSEMLSGLVRQYDPRHLDRISTEIQAHGGSAEETEVQCYRLNELLERYGLRDVHYLSMDVEGAEYDILRSFDFEAVNIRVWGIENNYHDHRIPRLMKRMGYQMTAVVGDEFYLKGGALGALPV